MASISITSSGSFLLFNSSTIGVYYSPKDALEINYAGTQVTLTDFKRTNYIFEYTDVTDPVSASASILAATLAGYCTQDAGTITMTSAQLPATLGQKAMSASMAVVIASDQSAISMTGNVGGYTTLVQSTVVMSVAGSYATGDYMGTSTTPQSFASAVRTSGGTGVIKSLIISDKITTANVAMELWILDRTYTAPTDNAAWDLSDPNMLFVQAVIPISTAGWYASSAGQVYVDGTLSIPIKSNGTTLFYALVARGTTPSFTSADLTVTISILQD